MSSKPRRPALARVPALILALALLLPGCAMDGPKEDPYESFNRKVFAFNKALDKAVAKPVARAYSTVVPDFARGAVTNFFSNLNDVTVAINELLQGKVEDALETGGRIIFNSTFGIGGVIDFSTDVGFEKRNEDFGQTMGYWGFEPGPYQMLPLLGPSSLRDTVGLAVDAVATNPIFDPLIQRGNLAVTGGLLLLNIVNRRANLLGAERVLEAAALDEYVFIRNAYLQRRRYLVFDGNPPVEEFQDLEPNEELERNETDEDARSGEATEDAREDEGSSPAPRDAGRQ